MIMSSQLDDHILIVDDQASNVFLLQSVLEEEGYFNIKTTTDSRKVVSIVKEFLPDIILLDLMMPNLDGYAVMEQLSFVIPADTYLPILVLTADATSKAKLRALSNGAKDFLTKPLDQIEVLLRVKNLLKTRSLYLQQQRQNQVLEEMASKRTAQIQSQLEHLAALHTINTAIAGSLDLEKILNIALENVITQLKVDAADVLLFNSSERTLKYITGRGFHFKAIESSRPLLEEKFTGEAEFNGRIVYIPNLKVNGKDFERTELLSNEEFITYFGVPLITKGEFKGVLEIFLRTPQETGKDWLEFLETLGRQIAIAVDNAQLFASLQCSNNDLVSAYDATIEGWSKALDLRDNETEGHTLRVTKMTIGVMKLAGVTEAELVHIRRGALLHDIGKMGIPDRVLLKPGPLTDDEKTIMQMHPIYAFELLSPIVYLQPALDIPYCHHEKWDGTGYPRGLKGEQIPFAARIFSIIDVFDALTSNRPYRNAWSKKKTIDYIKLMSGSQFDPKTVDLFLRFMLPKEYFGDKE
jgi:response regulator RpfG family c-di-GMP phosphodiesterase